MLSRLRDSLYIIYQKRLIVKRFSESFLKKFSSKNAYKPWLKGLARPPPRDSLLIIASGHTFVNGVFRFFRQILRAIFGQGACWVFAVRWPQAVVSDRLRAGHARPLQGGGGLGWWYWQDAWAACMPPLRVIRLVGGFRKGPVLAQSYFTVPPAVVRASISGCGARGGIFGPALCLERGPFRFGFGLRKNAAG